MRPLFVSSDFSSTGNNAVKYVVQYAFAVKRKSYYSF